MIRLVQDTVSTVWLPMDMIRFVQDTVSMVTYGYDKVCVGYGVYG